MKDEKAEQPKPKKSPCCDNCGTEEAPKEKNEDAKGTKPPQDKGRPCCG